MVSTCDFDSQNSSSILLPSASFKPLVYNGEVYSQFLIDPTGNILNTKTNSVYKKSLHKDKGYLYVYLPLGKRGSVKGIRVHKAVAETFIPNPNNYTQVNHIDENKLNCSASNLEWVTPKENTNKYLAMHPDANNRKLSGAAVKEILRSNARVKDLAKKFGVSRTVIYTTRHRDNHYANFKQF